MTMQKTTDKEKQAVIGFTKKMLGLMIMEIYERNGRKQFGLDNSWCIPIGAIAKGAVEQVLDVPAQLQGGSFSARIVPPEQDNGIIATHFSYEFNILDAIEQMNRRVMPEMHAWVVIPDRKELVDMTIWSVPTLCERIGKAKYLMPENYYPKEVWLDYDVPREGSLKDLHWHTDKFATIIANETAKFFLNEARAMALMENKPAADRNPFGDFSMN